MGRVLVAVLGLSLIIERVTEKVLYLVPARSRKLYAWLTSTALGLLITFVFRFGIMKELGLMASSEIAGWLDYLVTGILLAAGSEPLHSLVGVLATKKAELQKRATSV
jgi:hypothetical protein